VTGLDKSYIATAVFGAISDTLDADGDITSIPNASTMPDEAAMYAATKRFTGLLHQTPPMASAIKVGGERLYKAHRRGETIERRRRSVKVHHFEVHTLKKEENTATFAVSCSSGTYVRTLVSDLASSLGTGAYLSALRRTRVGHFALQNANKLDEVTNGTILKCIIPSKEVVAHLPAVEISGEEERSLICNGQLFRAFGVEGSRRYRVEAGGELLAIYRDREDGLSKAEVVLCPG
jgi:tRNA pseudouridine55 synthase